MYFLHKTCFKTNIQSTFVEYSISHYVYLYTDENL